MEKNENIFRFVNNSEYHHREMGLITDIPSTERGTPLNLCSKMGAHLSKASTYELQRGPTSQHQLTLHRQGGPPLKSINLYSRKGGPPLKSVNLCNTKEAHLSKTSTYVVKWVPTSRGP
jgi:hypothetical protein